jgi:hypothetical protein
MRANATVCGLLLACTGAVAQTVHHATPSERFPAAWYPPDNDVTYTGAPVTGAPYEALQVMAGLSGGTRVARDSAGRMREDSEQMRPGPDGGVLRVRNITVEDPVSHCRLQWSEPWAGSGVPTASVQCMTPTLHYSGEPMWQSLIAKEPREEHPFPWETIAVAPLGERVFDGVRALGARRTITHKDGQSGAVQTSTMEAWSSPELKEIVAMHQVPDDIDIELREIVQHEPDASLFYPPAGYRVVTTAEAAGQGPQ